MLSGFVNKPNLTDNPIKCFTLGPVQSTRHRHQQLNALFVQIFYF